MSWSCVCVCVTVCVSVCVCVCVSLITTYPPPRVCVWVDGCVPVCGCKPSIPPSSPLTPPLTHSRFYTHSPLITPQPSIPPSSPTYHPPPTPSSSRHSEVLLDLSLHPFIPCRRDVSPQKRCMCLATARAITANSSERMHATTSITSRLFKSGRGARLEVEKSRKK